MNMRHSGGDSGGDSGGCVCGSAGSHGYIK